MQFNKRGEWYQTSPEKLSDDYFFDLGYFFAFALTLFAIGTFYSTISPIIPLVCFACYLSKYWIDRYNFIYVYEKEMDANTDQLM